ncbi:MAG TPA: hypothetical protein VFZ31_04245 [Vicinamibacterales bacterium]
MTERTLWLGATTVVIGVLLLLMFVTPRSLDGSGPTGLANITLHSIVVDPNDRQRLYLVTDLGVILSSDGGHTWRVALR